MSIPNIPDVCPKIDITSTDSTNLLLASIAFEELGMAHIINSEAEKIQYTLGTLNGQTRLEQTPTFDELLEVNNSVEKTLRNVLKNQMLLQFKLEDTITISTTSSTTTSSTTTTSTSTTSTSTTTSTTTSSTTSSTTTSTTTSTTSSTTSTTSTTTTSTSTTTSSTTTTSTTSTTTTTTYTTAGTAWSVGTPFGQGNAQYVTLLSDQQQKTVTLGLGKNNTPVGTVTIVRNGTNLEVTFTTTSPFVMSANHLYVNNVAPTNSAPGQFPYNFVVTDPQDYFTTHTFIIDVSAFVGQTIYISAAAIIYS